LRAVLLIYFGKSQNSIERFSFAGLMLLASISDIGVDSNLKLLQAGHFSLYVLSDKIDAHQKQELQR